MFSFALREGATLLLSLTVGLTLVRGRVASGFLRGSRWELGLEWNDSRCFEGETEGFLDMRGLVTLEKLARRRDSEKLLVGDLMVAVVRAVDFMSRLRLGLGFLALESRGLSRMWLVWLSLSSGLLSSSFFGSVKTTLGILERLTVCLVSSLYRALRGGERFTRKEFLFDDGLSLDFQFSKLVISFSIFSSLQ